MARGSEDVYSTYGSVPTVNPSGAVPGAHLGVQASPSDFGAQIGQGIEKVGGATGEVAEKFGQIYNENLMTQADIGFATKLGQLKADFTSKTGQAAYDAYPAYQAAIGQAFQDTRANLPLGAQHGFDMLGGRTMANHIADGSSYATSQLKEQQRYDGSSLTNLATQGVLTIPPSQLVDPHGRVAEHTADAIWGLQKQMDENHPGLKQNENGEYTFDESTPEGQGLKAQYEAQKSDIITKIQSNRFDVLSKNDAIGAYGMYLNERSDLPKQTQITLDAKFEPIVFNAHKENAVGHAVAQSQDDYSNILYNPQSLAARNNNPGNLRDPATGQFKVFNTPEEGAAAMQSDLTAKVSGNSPAMEKNFGKGYSPTLSNVITTYAPANENNTAAYIDTVSKETGFAPNQVLTTADIPKLQAAMTKVEAGGSSSGTTQKSYATNPDGSMFTQADYYRTHSEDVLAKGDAYADSVMPGDLAFKRGVRETLTNYMNKVKSDQQQQYMMDNKTVMRGITGELTKGNAPATEADLRAIPGMNDTLNRVAAQDPRFYETIEKKISEVQKQNTVTNSPNAYDTIRRTLEPNDQSHPNKITHQSELDSLLGKSDGTGINMKDYNDTKPALELPDEIKEPLLKTMESIKNANGNIDGKGEQRAIGYYNQVMDAYKKNESLGDKKNQDFASTIGQTEDVPYVPPTPSRMTQLSNWIKETTHMGNILVENPDGQRGYIPAANVEKALKLGYTKVE